MTAHRELASEFRANGPEGALLDALTPLCAALLRSAFGAGELTSVIKRAYLRAALRQLPTGRKPNISRIAVATGMTRKEVASLLRSESLVPSTRTTRAEQRAMRVIRGWLSDARYMDDSGRPRRLPLKGEVGSFESLVADYAGDVTPRSVLREMLTLDAIDVQGHTSVELKATLAAELATKEKSIVALSDALETAGLAVASTNDDVIGTSNDRVFRLGSSIDAALFHQTLARRSTALLNGMEQWVHGRRSSQKQRTKAVVIANVSIHAVTRPARADRRASSRKRA